MYIPPMFSAVFLLLLFFAAPSPVLAEDDAIFREYLTQAEHYLKENRPQEAGEALREATVLAGARHPFLHMRLAKHYHEQNLFLEAIAQGEKAVALAPSSKWFRYELAKFYLADKHYSKADVQLCTLLKLDPGFASGYALLAELYSSTRQYDLARLSMKRARLLGYLGKDFAEPGSSPNSPEEDLDSVTGRNMIFRFIKAASAEQAEAILREIRQGKLFEDFEFERMTATKGEATCGVMQSNELPEKVAAPLEGTRPYAAPAIIRTGRDYRIVQRILPFDPAAWRLLADGMPQPQVENVSIPAETAKRSELLSAKQLSGARHNTEKNETIAGKKGQPPATIAALHALENWKNAWEGADIDGYLAAYSNSFTPPDGLTFSSWREKRQKSLARPKAIRIKISDTVMETLPNNQVLVTFKQHYESDNYHDIVKKSLTMAEEAGSWKILSEWIVQELPR